ncbi:MAG: twin-arginine translocase subunit TatC [Microbacteriaceae bacterium]|jgi:sec-independent protein translocase protein TatC|nr:twin-arginine translocase subunit TatC [Microbacteriaceae bacterium]MDR9443400.1 twin-arginine translocase subunit TatC [Microbacteriaceae bacterium]
MARGKNPERKMSLADHLRELRKRLFWIASFILVGTVGGWFLFEPVFDLLQQPILELSERQGVNATVNFGTVVSAFDLRIQVSIFLGLLVSSPFWLYQLWAFITPGLKKNERRYSVAFIASSVPLFLIGTYIAWISLPNFVVVLLGFTPEGSSNVINASEYVLFAIRVLFIFGAAFVMPVVLVLLNFIGLIEAKSIIKGWRFAVFIIAVVAALVTPTAEPISMLLLMVPLVMLYLLAVGIAYLNDRRKRKKAEKLSEGLND